ncbi:MAG TPA: tetratricopeptide repeat protein, partial [Pyrinomonadaceae bacterium]
MSKWNRIGAAALAAALCLSPLATAPARAAAGLRASQQDAPSQAEQETFNRGRALFAKGQYEQAATVFRDFLKGNPNSFIADLMLLWLGRSYIELGRFDEATQVVARLREIRDTPFTDIFETELQTARTEAASRPAPPAAAQPTPRAQATPSAAVARATPTPTPARPRPTPRPTPAEVAARTANAPTTPELAVRGGGDAERPRTAGGRRGRNARAGDAARNAAQPPVVVATPEPTPAARPPRT